MESRSIISICTASTRCGCAIYYDSCIHLVADRSDFGDPYKGLDIIIQRVEPEIVIVAAAQTRCIAFLESRFNYRLHDIHRKQAPAGDVIDPAFTLAIVPNTWFSVSKGEQKLVTSEWVRNKKFSDVKQAQLFVSSRVKRSVDVCAIRSVSALDRYLEHEFCSSTSTTKSQVNLNDPQTIFESSFGQQTRIDQTQISQSAISGISNVGDRELQEHLMPILDVRYIEPGPMLSIDKATMLTLGIFSSRHNKRKDNSEDSSDIDDIQPIPSLYSILNQCQSIQGRKSLHTMMNWPLYDVNELKRRHEVVDYFLRPENKILRDSIVIQLKNLVPLGGLLAKLNTTVGSYKDLSLVYKTLWSYMAIIDLIKANECAHLDIINRIASLDSPGLRAAVDSIINVIDFESSKKEKRTQICIGVDQTVDAKMEVAKNLVKFCDEVGIQETAKYKDILKKSCGVCYIPRIGFMVGVEFSSMAEKIQIRSCPEFNIILETDASIYFKTERMEELDNNAGDIACDLIDIQESVVINLQNEITQHSDVILRLMELYGELDCLIAFSIVSSSRGYMRPDFAEPGQAMDIRGAFHPLHCAKYNIVPNDVKFKKEMTEKTVKIMIITGPNSCGKTTYMKTVCLITYMAHIGCFVPALYAIVPVVDAILTRMHSANSISTGLSTFATDLHQINYALARATERSLVAIDEFGKGTQARDGFHLLKGLIIYFANLRSESPHVIISTHFNRLIDHLLNYSELVQYKTFKVTRDPQKSSFIYEYKIIDGVSESSLADQVALKAGIPRAIIERANQIRDFIAGGRIIQPRPPYAA